jgi:phosphonate transport system substrate-binding protein
MKFLLFLQKLTPPIATLSLCLWALLGCTFDHPKGSVKNPITVSLIPSKDTRSLLTSGTSFKTWMERETGLSFDVQVPHSYVAVVEALGSKRADLAYLNTINFLIAEEKYKAEPIFISRGQTGKTKYRGQFITHQESGLKSIRDIHGKKMAYVDPTSASGYYLPAYQLLQLGIEPKQGKDS